jgi:hypothetical protein
MGYCCLLVYHLQIIHEQNRFKKIVSNLQFFSAG